MYKNLSLALALIAGIAATAQQASYVDPAQAYNRILVEKGANSYRQVGNYKVIGSPFLFGEKNKGNIYSKPETAKNIELSYNIYNQEVAFYSTANPDNELVKTPGSLDSFLLRHPALNRRVAGMLQAVKGSLPQPVVNIDVPEELRGLPVSVRNVLADLQRARKHTGG